MSFTAWRTKNQEFVTVAPLLVERPTILSTRPSVGGPDTSSGDGSSVNPSAAERTRDAARKYLQSNPPQPRECYQNAQKLCAAIPTVHYVLGRVTIPGYGTIDHAWNCDELGHFDITLGRRADFKECVFQAIVTLTADQVNTMTWMGMPPTIYEVFQTLQSAAA
jgi:hypothetical protein